MQPAIPRSGSTRRKRRPTALSMPPSTSPIPATRARAPRPSGGIGSVKPTRCLAPTDAGVVQAPLQPVPARLRRRRLRDPGRRRGGPGARPRPTRRARCRANGHARLGAGDRLRHQRERHLDRQRLQRRRASASLPGSSRRAATSAFGVAAAFTSASVNNNTQTADASPVGLDAEAGVYFSGGGSQGLRVNADVNGGHGAGSTAAGSSNRTPESTTTTVPASTNAATGVVTPATTVDHRHRDPVAPGATPTGSAALSRPTWGSAIRPISASASISGRRSRPIT